MREIIIRTEVDRPVFIYSRKVHYYETDQMGIVHHSNYLRWFEEARMAYMDDMGLSYRQMEGRKIIIPVLSASCEYKRPARFDDNIDIHLKLTSLSSVKFSVHYEVYNHDTDELLAEGDTGHAFVNDKMMPFRMKKEAPDIYAAFYACLEDKSNNGRETE